MGEAWWERLSPNATVVIARQKRFYSKLVYRAICDIVNYRDSESLKKKEIYEQAREWMYNGFDTEKCDDEETFHRLRQCDETMSFETACSMLKWNPDWVRARVKNLTRKDLEHIGRNGLI